VRRDHGAGRHSLHVEKGQVMDQDSSSDSDKEAGSAASAGTDYAANDVGGFEASVTSSYDAGIASTETHDTSSTPSTGYSDPSGSDLAGAAESSTETSPGPGAPSVGSLDTVVDAPTVSANTNQPASPEFSGAFSSAASIAAAALGIAAAARGMWGTAATAVASNNPGIQRGVETLANTVDTAAMKGATAAVQGSTDVGFFGFGADMAPVDFGGIDLGSTPASTGNVVTYNLYSGNYSSAPQPGDQVQQIWQQPDQWGGNA